MKKVLFFCLFTVFLLVGAFAQNATLREGLYRTEGSSDMVDVERIGNSSTNYKMTWFLGSTYDNPIIQSSGWISGNKLTVSITYFNSAYFAIILGPNHNIRIGNKVTYTIITSTMFVDEIGQIWTWWREYL